MANEKISVEIDIEEKKALAALTKLTKGFDSVGDDAKKAGKSVKTFSSSIIQGFGVGAGLGAINALGRGAKKLFNTFVTDGIKAAKVQEDAINELNVALKLSGKFTEQTSQDLQDYASSLQNATKFGDETILSTAALIQSLGQLEKEGLKKATAAAVDMSAALGIDLRAAATLVGKAAAGEISSFTRYGVVIKKGADASATFANALEGINAKFGGAAAGQVKTFSGAVQQLENSFGDLQEKFGQSIIENDNVIESIRELKNGFDDFGKTVLKNAPEIVQTLASLTKHLLITPAKFWTETFFGGDSKSNIEELNTQIAETEKKIDSITSTFAKHKDNYVFNSIFGKKGQLRKDQVEAMELLSELRAKRDALMPDEKKSEGEAEDPRVKKEKETSQKILEQRALLQTQLNQIELDKQIQVEEQKLASQDLELEEREAALERLKEFEIRKADEEFNAQIEKNKKIEDAEARKIANLAALGKKDLANQKANAKASAEIDKQRVAHKQQMVAGFGLATQQASQLARKGSKEQQSLAAASALINTYAASARAYKDYPFPANVAVMATTIGMGLKQVSEIKKQSFATGGVVGGFQGATGGGDNRQVNARDGEMFLNAPEQRTLFDIATGKVDAPTTQDNQMITVVLEADGRELARVVRDAKRNGAVI